MTVAVEVVPRLEIVGASKTFRGRKVLRDVHLTIRPGEIHGVVGQNGSGKSTLAKIISGYHGPDAGARVKVDGVDLHLPLRLRDLHATGVSIVYQDLGLLPDRSIVANVRIGSVAASRVSRRIDWSTEADQAAAALRRLGFDGSLSAAVTDLKAADRARVAIARALQERHAGRGLIVFDESTRALPEDALVDFYSTIRALATEGTSILMIGHRLSEILEHCDRVSVLRDGALVASGLDTGELSESELASIMLGQDLAHLSFPDRASGDDEHAVRITSLEGPGLAAPVNLTIRPGEILGLAGLPGSGYESIPYLLGRASTPTGGQLWIGAETVDLTTISLTAMARRGVVLIPEERLREGLCAEHSVRDNIALPWLDLHGRRWAAGRRWQRREAQAVLDGLHVVPRDYNLPVARLSGGNQQKVLLGKWLAGRPKLLLLHEPTQAVDIKARHDILDAVHRVAAAGTPVLLASSEAPDLALLCDRVVIFRDGAIDQVLAGPCDPCEILDATYRRGATHD